LLLTLLQDWTASRRYSL